MKVPPLPARVISLIAAAGIGVHLVARYVVHSTPAVYLIPLFIVLVLGGLPIIGELLWKAAHRDFGSDLLAGISIVTSALLGQYLVGAIVVLMLSGGAALEAYALHRASSVLDALARRMPRIAHRKSNGDLSDVAMDQVAVGDLLVVHPHELCPVDGIVVEGRGKMDEAYLTGEPFEIHKIPGAEVLSGAINGESVLTIRATKPPSDSRYAKIMQVMLDAEKNRPRIRRVADQLGAWYTPLAVALAALGWIVSGDPARFLAVLVIATPCPLLIAIPVVLIGSISLAARRGIIIRNAAMLEQIGSCRTLIFDKTGTLTEGRPALTDVLCAEGVTRERALMLAGALEQYSKHPLSAPILGAAAEMQALAEEVLEISERPGEGLRGTIGAAEVKITGRPQALRDGAAGIPPAAGGMECVLLIDGKFGALFRFRDEPRKESHGFIKHLSPKHNVSKIMLLSGDRESEVKYLAGEVGITEVHFEKSPEEKVSIVRSETQRAKTLFVGDGINDAPAMQAATVGLAFGQGNEITVEAADAVVLDTSLAKVDELIHVGQRMRRIALQCAVGGMALSAVGMLAAVFGWLPPLEGAIAQEIIDLGAVLNAVRVAIPPKQLSDV